MKLPHASSLALVSTVALFALPACSTAQAQGCAALQRLALPDTTVTMAEEVPTGKVQIPTGKIEDAGQPFCRVAGVIRPSADSHIRFEVWLPLQGWNHRYLGVGNGGFAGSIYYDQLAGNLQRGFATAGTDAGHQADAEDASWAYKHPEKVKDFGWRALHLTTLRAKAIAAKFYGTAPQKSYFDSCSDGGREALMEVQRFPEDFDGILAGAPANNWTHLLAGGMALNQAMLRNPVSYIPSLKLPAITRAVLAQCDAQDGSKDGILNDPRQCHFDPATIACKPGEDTPECLTPPQAESLRAIYTGGKTPDGTLIFPGLMPGDEAGAWPSWVIHTSLQASPYVSGYFVDMVYGDPAWNLVTADAGVALRDALARTAQDVDATDPDLSRFVARGGKLVMYHGWNDPAISPLSTVAYYEAVQAKLGRKAAKDAVRLYMVPGMEHCVGGPGPSVFGQLGLPTAVADDKFAIFHALETWTEGGAGPGVIVATKYDEAKKPVMTRPICPYPGTLDYSHAKDPKVATILDCKMPLHQGD